MSFDRPRLLLALLLLLPLALEAFLHFSRRRGVLDLFREGKARPISFRYFLSAAGFAVFFACAVIALAGPRQGFVLRPDHRRGTDLALALDLSRSMDARDGGGPSRLERAVSLARNLLAAGGGGGETLRWAAAVGKGSGMLLIPLTEDAGAVDSFLAGISTASLEGQGTNLESLVNAALGAFKRGFPGKRYVLLLSDGEALQGNLGAALDRAAEEDAAVIAVGLGDERGAPVPGEPEGQTEGGPAGGTPGQPAVTRLERGVLENAARRTGGVYIDGMRGDAARLVRESLAGGNSGGPLRRESRSVAHLFVLGGVAALAASKGAGKVRKDRLRQASGLLSGGLVLALLLGSCSAAPGKLKVMAGNLLAGRDRPARAIASYLEALDHPETAPYAEYGLGVVYLALEEEEAALGRFAAAEAALDGGEHGELRYRLHYNRGIIFFEGGDYTAAAGEFRKALENGPGHIEAKRNLELSLLSLEQRARTDAASQGGREGEEEDPVLEYARRREEERWRNQEWAGTGSYAGPDY